MLNKKIFICLLLILNSCHEKKNNDLENITQSLFCESPIERLNCSWRSKYSPNKKECDFCKIIKNQNNDNKNFVLKRFKNHIVMLNTYPYTSGGNLLVIPNKHLNRLNFLDQDEQMELIKIISMCEKILMLSTEGLNIGINIGEFSGASMPDHLHIHLVTRKKNDFGFMNLIANSYPIAAKLSDNYEKLKPIFEKNL